MAISAAFVALVNENDELLCLLHSYGGGIAMQNAVKGIGSQMKGAWGIPGGYIDRGETPFQGAVREFSEEVGVRYPIDGIFSIVEIFPDEKSIVYVSRVKKRDVNVTGKSPSREITAVKWMTKKELAANVLRPIFAKYYELVFIVAGI